MLYETRKRLVLADTYYKQIKEATALTNEADLSICSEFTVLITHTENMIFGKVDVPEVDALQRFWAWWQEQPADVTKIDYVELWRWRYEELGSSTNVAWDNAYGRAQIGNAIGDPTLYPPEFLTPAQQRDPNS